MKRWTDRELKERRRHVEKLKTLADAVEDEISVFNEKMTQAFELVVTAAEAYNAALEDAQGFMEDKVRELEEKIDDHSPKWRESEAGEQHLDTLGEWESLDFEGIDTDPPDLLSVPDMNTWYDLESLSENSDL